MTEGKRLTIGGLKFGDRFDGQYLVKAVKTGETRAGKPYLVVTVQDRTGEISGPIWDHVAEVQPLLRPGNVVRLCGTVQAYRDTPQLRIDSVDEVARESVDLHQFLPATPQNQNKMAAEVQGLVRTVADPYIKKLLHHFFGKGVWWDRFQQAPAAKGVHHAYLGGLLEHSLSVAKVAAAMADHYDGVDRSLLLAGALLHDIGKLEELEMANGVIDYTAGGRLKGHLVIGCEMVNEAAASIADFPADILEQLQHLILSHHGRQEFGSPTVPMTVEAFILSMVDDLDAKLNITEQLRRKMDGGRLEWTEYQRILERYLYLGPLEQEKKMTIQPESTNDKQPSLF